MGPFAVVVIGHEELGRSRADVDNILRDLHNSPLKTALASRAPSINIIIIIIIIIIILCILRKLNSLIALLFIQNNS